MARSTARSLADRTVSAVRTVVGRRGPTESAAPADPKAVVKKVAAKTAPPAKKAPVAKEPAAKKPAAKKPAAKKPAAKKPAAKRPAAEKPAAKKPAPGKTAAALPVQSGESAWTSVELAEVVDDLRSQRDHALAVMAAQSDQLSGLMRDAGDGAGQDQADVGSTTFERDQELTILSSERDKLTQIDRALARIDDGSYGTCEGCEEPIGKMRLMAFPRATLCMTCKQREERR